MFLASVEAQRRAFLDLRPQAAPRELDGCVVAALQAGHRQDRAVAALRSLERTPMPHDADLTIWPAGAGAPPVLDRIVEQNLQDPTHSIARRFAGRLERLQAPQALRPRVEALLPLSDLARTPRSRAPAFLVGSLMLLGLVSAATWFAFERSSTVDAGGPLFVIERLDSSADLDSVVGSTFSSLLGGLPEAEARARKEKL